MSPIDATLKQLPAEVLGELTIEHGAHDSRATGVCVMEAVAWYAGEPHSDMPACACPVIAVLARRLNDRIETDEERTRVFLPLVIQIAGSRSTREVEIARGCAAADFTVRTVAPTWMELREGMADLGARLRAIPPLVTRADCKEALPEIRAVREEARARQSLRAGQIELLQRMLTITPVSLPEEIAR